MIEEPQEIKLIGIPVTWDGTHKDGKAIVESLGAILLERLVYARWLHSMQGQVAELNLEIAGLPRVTLLPRATTVILFDAEMIAVAVVGESYHRALS